MNQLTVTDGVFATQTRLAVAARVLNETDASQALPYLGAQPVADALAETTRIRAARAEVLRDNVALLSEALRSGIEELLTADRQLAAGMSEQ